MLHNRRRLLSVWINGYQRIKTKQSVLWCWFYRSGWSNFHLWNYNISIEISLKMLHFENNEAIDTFNRLSKIQYLVDALNENFKQYYDPQEMLCTGESLIPFRERSRQYLKQKSCIYGIKAFKLRCECGYTYSFLIYTILQNLLTKKILQWILHWIYAKMYLIKFLHLYVDNWYSSTELTNKLVKKNMQNWNTENILLRKVVMELQYGSRRMNVTF